MSFLASLEIGILATLILTFLQLKTGIFAMLYHFASGKKGKRYADVLTFYYMVGILLITAPLATVFLSIPDSSTFRTIMASICFALAFLALAFYFRYKKGSQLYLMRTTVTVLNAGAKKARWIDALMLGIASGIVEFIFTVPVYLIVAVEINNIDRIDLQAAIVIAEVLAGIIPVLLYHSFFWRGLNIADIGKLREKNKDFYRYVLFICYMSIGLILINFGGLF